MGRKIQPKNEPGRPAAYGGGAIDVTRENLISLREAADLLPRRRQGKHPHVSCMYRWTTHGCRGVVLASVNVGGTRCTSKEALARFILTLSAQSRIELPSGPKPCPVEVDRELEKLGFHLP